MSRAGIAGAITICLGLLFAVKAANEWSDRRQREAVAEERRNKENARRQEQTDLFNAQRDKLLADAKQAFIDSDPRRAVELLAPYEAVADSEALAVLRLAQSQADEIGRAEARQAEHDRQLAEAEQEARKEQACRANLKCWSNKHQSDSFVMCTRAVERSAKYQSEWIDGLLSDLRFTVVSAGSRDGSILWAGDQVKFQNGFGAWQQMLYVCDFDPASGSVVDMTVKPRN